jgi:hypothetical protein
MLFNLFKIKKILFLPLNGLRKIELNVVHVKDQYYIIYGETNIHQTSTTK